MRPRDDGALRGLIVALLTLLALCAVRVGSDVKHHAWTFETGLATLMGCAFALLATRAAWQCCAKR